MSMSNSPLSYTNKDFQSIYEELLTIAKQLSYKWDPTISNESDPGVVLLKLNAIIADKNNYNIDKNILETFVDTVTQDVTARQLFSQLGYKMPWYNAASTDIVFEWIGEELLVGQTIKIPKFTMLTDVEGKYVYTITRDAEIGYNTKNFTTTVPALEGKIVNYTIAGSKIITEINFDNNNRLYLNDSNVAQNGLFINNIDDEIVKWTLVDNIQLYPTGSYVFEFGVDARTNTCYLEFPEDFHNLIGSGLEINYIITTGRDGNVASKTIESFYNDMSVELGSKSIALDSDNMLLYNNSASKDGKHPENIDDATKSYKRVAGTFNTLVTLRDYINAIYNSGIVSNVKVSDRLNDVQTSYTVLTDTESTLNMVTKNAKIGENETISFVKLHTDSGFAPVWQRNTYYSYDSSTYSMQILTAKPDNWESSYDTYYTLYSDKLEDLTAYDLRLYLLASPNTIKDLDSYNKTFDVVPSKDTTTSNVKNYILNTRCVQHNFKDILKDKPCLFTNIYPLDIKIIPQYRLNDEQIYNLKKNISDALIANLNSRKVNFGEEPNYDKIYQIIEQSDSRIKLVILDDFTFTTFATYWDGEEFKQVPVSEFNSENIISVKTKEDIKPKLNGLKEDYKKGTYLIVTTDDNYNCYKAEFRNKQPYIELKNKDIPTSYVVYSDKIKEFRTDIIAKSVLAGKTSLFDIDNRFRYTLSLNEEALLTDISRIDTEVIIAPFSGEKGGTTETSAIPGEEKAVPTEIIPTTSSTIGDNSSAHYTLDANVSMQFYAPAFKTVKSFSNYVKFLLILKNQTGWDYEQRDLIRDDEISILKPVYIHLYDPKTGTYRWEMYTTNTTVSDNYGHKDTIRNLVQKGTLSVYTRKPSYTIPANTDYKLKDGDLLIFFWKESSDEVSPYIYEVYKGIKETEKEKSPIITANFTLIGKSSHESPIRLSALNLNSGSGKIKYSNSKGSVYSIVSGFYGDNDLAGTKTIDIKDLRQIKLENNKHYYYFITNKIIKEENIEKGYQLDFKVDTTTKTASYILKDDEYFLYTDRNQTSYEVLGSGTLLQLQLQDVNSTDEILTYKVDYMTSDTIIDEGIDSFKAIAKTLDKDLIIREQQIYNFTEGDTVYFDLDESYYNKAGHSKSVYYDGYGIPSINLQNKYIIDVPSIRVSVNDTYISYNEPYTYQDANDNYNANFNPNFVVNEYIGGHISNQKLILEKDDDEGIIKETEKPVYSYNITIENLGKVAHYKGNTFYYRNSTEHNSGYSIDGNEYATNGKDYYIISDWKEVGNNNELFENQSYFASKDAKEVEGNQLSSYDYVVYNSNSASASEYRRWFTKLTFEKITILSDTDKFYYISSTDNYGNSTYTIYEDNEDSNQSDYVEGYNIIIGSQKGDGEEGYAIVSDECTYDVTYNVYTPAATPVIKTDIMTPMNGVEISYELKGEDSIITPLPSIDIDDSICWQATASYNLSSGYNEFQTIPSAIAENDEKTDGKTNGKLIVLYRVDDKLYTCRDKEVKVVSSATISKVGGRNVDVTYVDLYGNRQSLDLLFYTDVDYTNDNNKIEIDKQGNILIKMTKDEFKFSGIKLDPDYYYMLPIRNKSDIGRFSLMYSTNDNKEDIFENEYSISDFASAHDFGMSYFIFKLKPSITDFNLHIIIDTPDENADLVIYPLLKYKDITDFSEEYGISTNDIITRMQELDTDSEFKYNHIVSEDSAIPNPLLSKSFLDVNHIFNEYVITKAEMDMAITANRSKISLINNR